MLSKKNRAGAKEIGQIFKKSSSLISSSLTFKYFRNKNNSVEIRISFIAPKNIAKLAVERNLLRRRGYFALKKCAELSPPGIIGVFIFKKYQDDVRALADEIKNIFNKIN